VTATTAATKPAARTLLGATALAPLAWVVHIALLPPLVPYACDRGSLWPLHLATAVLLAVAALGVVAAHRARRQARADERGRTHDDTGRGATFATVGVVVSWLFTALIVAEHLPVFVIDACSR
jgi:hypothetical protein